MSFLAGNAWAMLFSSAFRAKAYASHIILHAYSICRGIEVVSPIFTAFLALIPQQ